MAARRARAGGGKVGAARSVANRDLPGRQVAYQLGDEKRRDVAQPGLHEDLVVLLDRAQAADADADQHADVVGIVFGDLEPRLAHRLLGRRDRILDERVHLFDVALFDPVLGIKILHLACDAGGEFRGVEARDRPDTGPSRHQGVPVLLHSNSERRHQSDSGYDHAALKHLSHQAPHPPSSSTLNHLSKRRRWSRIRGRNARAPRFLRDRPMRDSRHIDCSGAVVNDIDVGIANTNPPFSERRPSFCSWRRKPTPIGSRRGTVRATTFAGARGSVCRACG